MTFDLTMSLKNLLPPRIFEALDRVGISTTKKIIILSTWDIKKYTNLSIDDILLVKKIVCELICPQIVSCDVLKRQESSRQLHVATGCNVIDNLLRGGLRRGIITEVFGEGGCGKTQLALQISLNNWTDGSLYLCTEDLFPIKRFEELKRALPTFDTNIDYGKNIFVEHLTEASELLSCISVRLPKLLAQNKLSIVIIDSIAAPFRCETTNYIKRAEDLREIAILLTEMAQKYNLAILCINQVTASFDESSNVIPCLGLAWSNMIPTRLMIRKTIKVFNSETLSSCSHNNYIRELSVTFAPNLPNAMTEFVITSNGIQTTKT